MLRITHRESEGENVVLLNHSCLNVGVDEGFQTLRTEVKEDLTVFLLLLFGEAIFRLCDLEFAVALQRHQAYSKVGST